jgi:hypothetical protein
MNYDLLKPFDLEAAKRGEEICDVGGLFCVYIDGPDNLGHVAVKCSGNLNLFPKHDLRMRPLAWVEDHPVYKGDKLWYKTEGLIIADKACGDGWFFSKDGVSIYPKSCTWTKPEPVKKTRTVKFLAWLLPNGHLVNIAEDAAICMGYKRVPSEDKTVEVEE